MPVTGRVSQNQLTLQRFFDSAFRRIGVPTQTVTAEYIEIARELLGLTMSEFVTTGVSLWTNGVSYLGMQAGRYELVLPDGTLEIDRAVLLRTNTTSATVSGSGATWLATASTAVGAEFVGVRVSTAGFYNIAIDTSPDNVTFTEVDRVNNAQMVAGVWNWFEISPTPSTVLYYRIRETTSVTLPVTGAILATGAGEVQLNVEGQDTYANLPNKRQKGNVTSYYTERRLDGPVMFLWNAPGDDHANFILQVWRKRHMTDLGDMASPIDIPQRWADALIWDLAWRLAAEIPEAKKAPEELINFADRARRAIAPSETDGGVISFGADISAYTA